MKRRLAFSFLILGISSLVAQVVLIRELMIVFYGNEFFIGWTLFAWLFWVGLGSALFSRILKLTGQTIKAVIACHALIALLLPVQIFLVRSSRIFVGGVPGQAPDLLPSVGFAFLALAPLCLILGGQFVAGAKAWKANNRETGMSGVLGRSYVYETIGFVLGGILFGYLLVVINEFRVAGIVAWLNVAAGAILYAPPRNRAFTLRLALIAASAIATVTVFLAIPLNNRSARYHFPDQELVDSANSIYGNVAVTLLGDQYNFYENGLLFGSTADTMWNEYLVHFPMLYHPNPKHVLLLGGGLTGALDEILKHDPDRVDYVELDPLLITMTRRYLPPETTACLEDPRVHTVAEDARFFLNRLARDQEALPYDVIIVNLPNPSTILINRFYSKEFFELAKSVLEKGGILCTHLAFSPDYLSPELENLGSSIYKTISAAFPSVVVLPEYTAFFIASADISLEYKPLTLIDRLEERDIQTKFLSAPYIDYRLTTDRINSIVDAFEKNSTARINHDHWPVACYYNFLYWMSSFYPNLARKAQHMEMAGPAWLAGILVLVAMLVGITTSRGSADRRTAALALWAMAVGSFSLMAAEVVIILMFQILYGYLYHQISLIIAALMLGMAAGTWTGTKVLHLAQRRTLQKIHAVLAAYMFVLGPIFMWVAATLQSNAGALRSVFLLLAVLMGCIVGFEFTVANKLYLDAHDEDHRKTGLVYAIDLLGSCLGALLISMWLVPLIGVTFTLLMTVILNGIILVAATVGPRAMS